MNFSRLSKLFSTSRNAVGVGVVFAALVVGQLLLDCAGQIKTVVLAIHLNAPQRSRNHHAFSAKVSVVNAGDYVAHP